MNDTPNGTPNGSSNAAAIAGLAREVQRQQQVTDRVPELEQKITELAHLLQQVAQSGNGAGGSDDTNVPPSWLALRGTGAEPAESVLGALIPWIEDVYLAYDDAGLPECWLWHPGLVEELVWLMHDWKAAHPAPDRDADKDDAGERVAAYSEAAAIWHDRYRPGVVARINDTGKSCSLVKHTGRPRRTAPLHQTADQIATWWGARPDQPPVPGAWHFDLADKHQRQQEGRHP